MTDIKKSQNKSLSDATKLRHAIDFVEELSWLLESKNKLKLSEIPSILRDAQNTSSSSIVGSSQIGGTEKYISPNPNVHYLVGILPSFFLDNAMFPKNDDIIIFATEALKIDGLSSRANRSRYEIIGRIVCECTQLDDSQLNELVVGLSSIAGNKEKMNQVVKAKQTTGFSWNETIRKLAK
ncbi:hypothetical protein CAG58_14300 [Vibrio sp. V31_P5A7T61]|uniref:hypothetical protein n=1 Tax=unclassified Vibrio TaxID=2614977 RepID=UPI001373145A|nr:MULTISPECIES: hypothetical protein [unclassified Vibrio]NAW63112.1 hypothetical protein [Vibrio sp. V31_P5A7T61]NAX02654.1 hypothetical protein [Vibrio sp. V34_P3A8T189]NAX64623.1 hypothetical protein [Vibrio sp. V32_P6A28T40]